MHTVTIEQARQQLEELVSEASRGVEIVIMKGTIPVAKLTPAETVSTDAERNGFPLLGLLRGKIEYREGWEETPEEFRPYME